MPIKIVPLGAGQDVGRSCIIAEVGGRTIMLDCGIHMVDQQKFPDFSFLYGGTNNNSGGSGQGGIPQNPQFQNSTKNANGVLDLTNVIDCVLISHFHLDHCGALPYFTEAVGYSGPIVATPPTKAIIPLMLEDFRKVSAVQSQKTQTSAQSQANAAKQEECFNQEMIKNCINKIQTIQLHETLTLCDGEIKVTAYYAGHVLGAAMFHVECNGETLVYTGDYNMSADRHLGAAWIDKLRPDVVLTETTYATTIRDSKRSREREFLKQVHATLEKGGKVLIPVFALGRAQELCILLETYWRRAGLQYPIYFSGGLTEKANFYYKLFINWTNEKIKKTFIKKNMFDFSHVRSYDQSSLKADQPMVFFATPGMLHGGLSLQTFKEWAGNEKNAVIIPGYCMPGTVGNRILSGEKKITIDDKVVHVKMQVYNMSFSAHADSKGIMELLSHLEPKNVILVHGEKEKMRQLSLKIKDQLKVPVFYPPNYSVTKIVTEPKIDIAISASLINRMNRVYQQSALLYYRSTSQIFLPHCLLVAKGDTLELHDSFSYPVDYPIKPFQMVDEAKDAQEEEKVGEDVDMKPEDLDQKEENRGLNDANMFTFENKWTSGPLRQYPSAENFKQAFLSILTVEIIKQKKQCLGIDLLLFEQEEFAKAAELARNIFRDFDIVYSKEMQEVTLSFGALEDQVGFWLIDIINTKLL